MLHTPLSGDQVVDSEAAMEFMKEATKVASSTQLEDLGARLEAKGALFAELLAEERIAELDEADLGRLLGSIFSLRRRAGRLLRANPLESLRGELQRLLYGEAEIGDRFDRFTAVVGGIDRGLIIALASEALHFTAPHRYWLWTYWIWNPATGTGALPLVLHQQMDLAPASDGEAYREVGEALVRVDAVGQAVGFSRSGKGLFGTDVFLACVYAVYMYTVFKVKLSQEFNRILPELPELAQRVLGVREMGVANGR